MRPDGGTTMPDRSLESAWARLAALERTKRRLTVALAAGSLAALAIGARAAFSRPAVVDRGRGDLVVVDDRGRPRARLLVEPDGSSRLDLLDPSGREAALLHASTLSAGLALYERGRFRLDLAVGPHGRRWSDPTGPEWGR